MKLLVIGASGFIGSHLFTKARQKRYEVIGTRCSSDADKLIKYNLLTDDVKDILPSNYIKAKGPVYAIICSSVCKLNQCYYEREMSYKLNVTNTINLINDLNKLGIKCVFISTEFVFDGQLGYYDEMDIVSPVNEYGRHKAEVEQYITSQLYDNLIIRLSKVVGDSPDYEHFFSDCYKKAIKNADIECIHGQTFSPTNVEDVAEGIILSLELNLKGIYHLSNQEYFTRGELAKQFLICIDKNVGVIEKPLCEFSFPEKRPIKTYLDGTKFTKETGMKFTSMKETMRRFNQNIKHCF